MKRNVLAILLAATMAFSLLPATAFAEEVVEKAIEEVSNPGGTDDGELADSEIVEESYEEEAPEIETSESEKLEQEESSSDSEQEEEEVEGEETLEENAAVAVAASEDEEDKIVAEAGGEGWVALNHALKYAYERGFDTVYLLEDVENGEGIVIDKPITIDFKGHTYKVTHDLAGSKKHETQCFQILDSAGEVTLKNGTIIPGDNANLQMGIQNYANTTLENMTLKNTKPDGSTLSYTMSNNSGNVQILGNTTIEGKMDVSYWPGVYPAGTSVTIDTTGTIGEVEIGFYGKNGSIDVPSNSVSVLNIKNGKVGELSVYAPTEGSYGFTNVTLAKLMESASISVAEGIGIKAPDGYKWVKGKLGPAYVAMIGEVGYQSLEKAFDDAIAAAKGSDVTIKILEDIKVDTWTEKTFGGGKLITVNGNGHSITGITHPLFGHTGSTTGIVFNDLTVKDSTINGVNCDGAGATCAAAFVGCAGTSEKFEFNNCNVIGCTLQ
ncbi:MAG: hypothetical protein HUJ70_01275, partial [Pseudobutyrivibrio sp.]|nr:hypothetical protein [Pseudobutyrivibrio sp.]